MKISVAMRIENLLRSLRLTGHSLAEREEMAVLRAARRQDAATPRVVQSAVERGGEGVEP